MKNINPKPDSNTGSQNKNTNLIADKRDHRKHYTNSYHNHSIHIFLSHTTGISYSESNSGSNDKSTEHHPEPKQTISQNTVYRAENEQYSKPDHGNISQGRYCPGIFNHIH